MKASGIPLPQVSAWMAGGTEFFGGVLLILGVATRLVSLPMAFTMFVAAFAVHGAAFSAQAGGMEYPLTLGVMLVGLVFLGGGDWTVTRAFERRIAHVPVSST